MIWIRRDKLEDVPTNYGRFDSQFVFPDLRRELQLRAMDSCYVEKIGVVVRVRMS